MNMPEKPAFITDDGEVFEIPDLPDDLGRACALASEATLRKFWNTPAGETQWRDLEGIGQHECRRGSEQVV